MDKMTDTEQRQNIDEFTEQLIKAIHAQGEEIGVSPEHQLEMKEAFLAIARATKNVVGTVKPALWAIALATFGEALIESLRKVPVQERGGRTIEEMISETIGIKSGESDKDSNG